MTIVATCTGLCTLAVGQLLKQAVERIARVREAAAKHLRTLLRAGVVTDERRADDARVRVFRLRGDSVVAVRAWLDRVQAGWDEQLAAFARHVEDRRQDGVGDDRHGA